VGQAYEISAPARGASTAAPNTVAPNKAARALARAVEGLFGLAALVVGLAVVAPVPVLGLAALGYAVVAEARVAQSGQLREALFGVRAAARAGTIAAFAWAALLVPRALAARAHDARLVDPDGGGAGFSLAAGAALVLALAYVACACSQGGRARDFLRPRPRAFAAALVSGDAWAKARDEVWIALATGALPLLAAGARALLIGVAWLVAPTTLLFVATRVSGGPGALAGALGAGLLAIALVVGPYAQGRAALSGTLRAGLDVRGALAAIARAPIASLLATLVTLLLAAPLHLLKIEPVPPGAHRMGARAQPPPRHPRAPRAARRRPNDRLRRRPRLRGARGALAIHVVARRPQPVRAARPARPDALHALVTDPDPGPSRIQQTPAPGATSVTLER